MDSMHLSYLNLALDATVSNEKVDTNFNKCSICCALVVWVVECVDIKVNLDCYFFGDYISLYGGASLI